MLRRVLVSLAFANWCFLNVWLAFGDHHLSYFLRADPVRTTLAVVIAWEAALVVAMLLAWEICSRLPARRTYIEALFLATCAVPIGIAATALASRSPVATRAIQSPFFWVVAILLTAYPIGYAALHPRTCGPWMRSLFLWSWPVLATVLIQASFATLVRYRSADFVDSPMAPRLPATSSNIRVVWLVFDELGQKLAFRHRPTDLDLPNFDRLKSESFYATEAFAPAEATMLSLPALILGEKVIRAEPDGPADLRLQTASHSGWFSWKSAPNVFDTARAAGFNTAIVGWYHPYGRLLNRSLTECLWTANAVDPGAEEALDPSLMPAMRDRAWRQISSLPLAGRLSVLSSLHHDRLVRTRDFNYLLERALNVVADPEIGLALIHLPVPHPPGIYRRVQGEMDTDHPAAYVDNVALADRTLGELRRKMEQSAVWDRTAVIVSADHGWRVSLWRGTAGWTSEDEALASTGAAGVPFIVKLPGRSEQLTYDQPFDTVVTREILMSILLERVTTTAQVLEIIRKQQD